MSLFLLLGSKSTLDLTDFHCMDKKTFVFHRRNIDLEWHFHFCINSMCNSSSIIVVTLISFYKFNINLIFKYKYYNLGIGNLLWGWPKNTFYVNCARSNRNKDVERKLKELKCVFSYLAYRTCLGERGSPAGLPRLLPECAGRVEKWGSWAEACDPGPAEHRERGDHTGA